jgi:uncharacterized RDD family membrane protein YckC
VKRRREASRAALGGDEDESFVEILTPENVPVRFAVARAGDRVAAFAVDAAIIVIGLLGVGLAAFPLGPLGGPVLILAAFAFRSFYFTWFEIRRQGQSPGKRKFHLRVLARRGGSLTAEAVFVRNVMREIELFVPLGAFVNPDLVLPVGGGIGRLLALAWVAVLAAMPLLNRERLRVGDLVAGTIVVRLPRRRLLPELSATKAGDVTYVFTEEQLDVYGIYELQVLEDLLRESGDDGRRAKALGAVGERIRKKIGFDDGGAKVSEREFLRDFYAAQRARLEGRLLLGERRERKRG